jgi:hypothetical protein
MGEFKRCVECLERTGRWVAGALASREGCDRGLVVGLRQVHAYEVEPGQSMAAGQRLTAHPCPSALQGKMEKAVDARALELVREAFASLVDDTMEVGRQEGIPDADIEKALGPYRDMVAPC